MSTIEHLFVTKDIDKTFNMIEDEDGDKFWGYGHRDGPEFVNEVNRWLIHVNAATTPDDLFPHYYGIEHFWAVMEDLDGERFKLVPADSDPNAFPVTRLVLTTHLDSVPSDDIAQRMTQVLSATASISENVVTPIPQIPTSPCGCAATASCSMRWNRRRTRSNTVNHARILGNVHQPGTWMTVIRWSM